MKRAATSQPQSVVRARLHPEPAMRDLMEIDARLTCVGEHLYKERVPLSLLELEQCVQEARRVGLELSRLAPPRRLPLVAMLQSRSLERLEAAREEIGDVRAGIARGAWMTPALMRARKHIVTATSYLHNIAEAIGQE